MKKDIFKFRAWNEKKQAMVYDNTKGFAEWWDRMNISSVQMVNGCFKEKEYKWMQWTGLADSDDVDVYEGDILEFEHLKGYSGSLQTVFVFNYSYSTNEYLFYEIVEREYKFKVVGNIYENPELLNGK